MYELIILSRLMLQPSHGYLIARIINDIIGPYAKVSNGRLYPLLAKLVQSGLITTSTTEHNDSERQARVYAITPTGKQRFHELMMDLSNHQGEYQQIFALKACAFTFLQPAERLHIIDHYIQYCQTHISHMKAEIADLEQLWQHSNDSVEKSQKQYVIDVIYHSMHQWQLELSWAQTLQKREQAVLSL